MRLKPFAAASIIFALAFGLGGCAKSATPTVELQGPVVLAPVALEGQTVTISETVPLVIATDEVEGWAGRIIDPEVAQFTEGRVDDTAEFAPAIEGKGVGETDVVITDPQGVTTQFTVVVTDDNAKVGPYQD